MHTAFTNIQLIVEYLGWNDLLQLWHPLELTETVSGVIAKCLRTTRSGRPRKVTEQDHQMLDEKRSKINICVKTGTMLGFCMAKQLTELSEHRSNHPGYQWVFLFLYITDVKHKAYGTESTQQRLRPGPPDRFGKCGGDF